MIAGPPFDPPKTPALGSTTDWAPWTRLLLLLVFVVVLFSSRYVVLKVCHFLLDYLACAAGNPCLHICSNLDKCCRSSVPFVIVGMFRIPQYGHFPEFFDQSANVLLAYNMVHLFEFWLCKSFKLNTVKTKRKKC